MRSVSRALTAVVALSLVAASCGGDEAATDTGDNVDEAAEMAFTSSSTTEPEGAVTEPGSMEELEAAWAQRRAEIVAELSSDEYGVGEDGILRGPGGLEVDLSRCPSTWSDTEGVGDTIRVAQILPQSGPLAPAGNIAVGMQTYFDVVNAAGGIAGTPIELVVRDDGYDPNQTVTLTDELFDEDVFAISHLGSGPILAVYDEMNTRCIPEPFTIVGHPAVGDPVGHPWTTGWTLSYNTEAILWGNWIRQNLADQLPVTVSALVMDNDFGSAYQGAFQEWADANPDVIASFQPVRHAPSAQELSTEMAAIQATQPDVMILMTVGNHCPNAIKAAAELGLNETVPTRFMPSVCKDPNSYLLPAGEAAEGYQIMGGGTKATTDPQFADDVYVSWVNEQLAAAGRDTSIGYFGTGFADYGWVWVEALRIAAELPGGLTRTNFILAIRSLDLDHPILLDGISFSMNGAEDGYLTEGSDVSRFDAATGSWVQLGGVIDLNGISANCSWSNGSC